MYVSQDTHCDVGKHSIFRGLMVLIPTWLQSEGVANEDRGNHSTSR